MWLPNEVVEAVNKIARIYYINKAEAYAWNEHRRSGELRMLTGWCWSSARGNRHRYGFKTITVAYRDAWYELVQERATPTIRFRSIAGGR